MKLKVTVLVTGVFDVIHVGHLDLLEYARSIANDNSWCPRFSKVIVGINSDDSVRRLDKAPNRPINQGCDRKRMLEALGYEVVIFPGSTASGLIRKLHPTFWVKGPDYKDRVPEELGALAEYGGQFRVMLAYKNQISTTKILENK
jgi:D-glycero-beta-D-manno-heptose 1-phosphate adenylyltransferase